MAWWCEAQAGHRAGGGPERCLACTVSLESAPSRLGPHAFPEPSPSCVLCRYGPDAAQASVHSMNAAGHSADAMMAARKLGVKTIAKSAVKGTAKGVIRQWGSSSAAAGPGAGGGAAVAGAGSSGGAITGT